MRTALAALTCGPAAPRAARRAVAERHSGHRSATSVGARRPTTFGAILGIKQVSDGKVLVNDARRRQLKLFDSTLTTSTVVRDSTPGSATSYGRLGTPLIPYLGDSSLIADWSTAQNMLLLDGHGQVVRAVDLPGTRHLRKREQRIHRRRHQGPADHSWATECARADRRHVAIPTRFRSFAPTSICAASTRSASFDGP